MKDFRDLNVWEKAHRLTLTVYRLTKQFPSAELCGLTSQIRRASASVPANIAEGCGRDGDAELARFMKIAAGSASEVEYHLLLAHDLGFVTDTDYEPVHQQICEVKRMLSAFIQKLKAN